jgi:hypothetical protein
VSVTLSFIYAGLLNAFVILFLLLLARVVLRKAWLAHTAVILMLVGTSSSSGAFALTAIFVSAGAVLLIALVFRVGFLAMAVPLTMQTLLRGLPLTFDTDAWYAGRAMISFAEIGAIVLWGFVTSLGGRPLVGRLEG